MACTLDQDKALGIGGGSNCLAQKVGRGILVMIAADEQFGFGAFLQETVLVASALGAQRKAQCDQCRHVRFGAAGGQSDDGSEREAGEDDGEPELAAQP